MKKLNITLFFVFFFACFSFLQAQKYTLSGRVIDSLSQEKLFYANVVIADKDSTVNNIAHATTEINGKFKIKKIPKGEFILKISYVGYGVLEQNITVGGENKHIDIGTLELTPQFNMLGVISVEARKPVYSVDGEKTIYNVSQDMAIQTGTASDALQNAPGVSVDIEGNVKLRGSSSVNVWINGKPSHMSGDILANYIRELPASALESVEVITNPSAKYNTKEGGGVINLELNTGIKKNSFISFGFRQSSNPSSSPWVSYALKNKKWTISLHLSYSFYNHNNTSYGYSTMFDQNKDTSNYETFNSDADRASKRIGSNINLSYDLDSMNSFSMWYGTGFSNYDYTDNKTNYRKEYDKNEIYNYHTEKENDNQFTSVYGSIRYEHKFNNEGHRLSFSSWNSFWGSKDKVNFNRTYEDENHMSLNKNQIIKTESPDFSISPSIDYSYPFENKKTEFEMGLDGDFSKKKDFKSQDVLNEQGTYEIDSLRTYEFNFLDKEISYYASLKQKFGDYSIKAGLRAKYEQKEINIKNSPEHDLDLDYFGLFPSLHISYRTKSMHTFKLSYTHRVRNPSGSSLNIFPRYSEDSYALGNSNLKSIYTHNIEFAWNKFFETLGYYGISLYYKSLINNVETVTHVENHDLFGRMVQYSMPVSIGNMNKIGTDFNISYRLKSFMRISLFGDMRYKTYDVNLEQYGMGNNIHIEDISGYMFLRYWAKLWKKLEVDASFFYYSSGTELFTENKPDYSLDIGTRMDFFDRKLSVSVRVNDIFNWNKSEMNNNSPYYHSFSSNKYDNRSFSLGLILRFGKMELEHHTKTGGGDEGEGNGKK